MDNPEDWAFLAILYAIAILIIAIAYFVVAHT